MAKSKLRIGYIARGKKDGKPIFVFRECAYHRRITSRSDKVYSNILMMPVDYKDIESTTKLIKKDGIIIVCEPFFLDEQLYDKATKWVSWANSVDPKEYDPFAVSDA